MDARAGRFEGFGAVEGELFRYDAAHVCSFYDCTPEELEDWLTRYKAFMNDFEVGE